MENIFLETNRLYLRKITQKDFDELASILQDKDVMYAWECPFSDIEVQDWIDKCISYYNKYNLGYFLAINKKTQEILGQAALMPDIINDKKYYEIGYILKKQYWHNGYAKECAEALAKYAFDSLNLNEVIFEIRPDNIPSRKVAESLGAKVIGEFTKNVKGKEMLHLIYSLKNPSGLQIP